MNNTSTVNVSINRVKCIGCGYCLSLAPELWVLSTFDGKVTSVDSPKYEDDMQIVEIGEMFQYLIKQSGKVCPTNVFKQIT